MLWYSDIERITLGKGSLVFCQYLIFDTPLADPLADQLLANLISMLQDDWLPHSDREEETRKQGKL